MVTEAGQPTIAEGSYSVSVGGGQPNTTAQVVTKSFQVKGKMDLPE
jgi:beta-glucosidase